MESEEEVKKKFKIFTVEFVKSFERELKTIRDLYNGKTTDLKQSYFLKPSYKLEVIQDIIYYSFRVVNPKYIPVNTREVGQLTKAGIQKSYNYIRNPKIAKFVGSCEKLLNQVDNDEREYEFKFRKTLIEGCFDIFYSYEMQISILQRAKGQVDALKILAQDSMIRSFNYLREKPDSKIYTSIHFGQCEKSAKLMFKCEGKNLDIKSDDFFCKPGLRKDDLTYYRTTSNNYYLYGFRRLLPWERMRNDYYKIKNPESKLLSYEYKLNYCNKMQYVDEILKEMSVSKEKKIWHNVAKSETSYSRFNTDKNEEIMKMIKKDTVVVLVGMTGIGKTTMAVKFCDSSHSIRKVHVMWIDATDDNTIRECVHKLCKLLRIPIREDQDYIKVDDLFEMINNCLKDNRLFVFDNAKDLASIKNYLIRSPNYKSEYLITSRNLNEMDWVSETITIQSVKLEGYDNEESLRYLKINMKIADDSQDECLKELCQKLKNYPIALRLAASDYNLIYHDKKKRKLEYNLRTYVENLSPEFSKQMEQILKTMLERIGEVKPWGQEALDMFDMISYISCQEVDEQVFFEYLAESQDGLKSITSCLEAYSMVEFNDNGMLSSHDLLHEMNRKRLFCENMEMITLQKILQYFLGVIRKLDGVVEKNTASKGVENIKKENNLIIDEELTKYIPHIVSLWNYAIKYEKLIMEFIVQDIGKGRHISYFHLLSGYSSYEIVKTVMEKVSEAYRQNKEKENSTRKSHIQNKEKQNSTEKFHSCRDIVNIKSHTTMKSSLHYAAESGCVEKVKLLLNNKAEVNIKTKMKYTPLHLAVYNGFESIVRIFLDEKNVEVDCATTRGYTPLHFAAKNGNVEIIEKLLNRGACINAVTEYKFTPLHISSKSGHLNAVKALLRNENIKINSVTNYDETPLFLAVKEKHLEIVKILLKSDADPNVAIRKMASENVKANTVYTALHEAVARNDLSIVKVLLGVKQLKFDDIDIEYLLKLAHESASNDIVNAINSQLELKATIND